MKTKVALAGLLLFIFCIYLNHNLRTAQSQAIAANKNEQIYAAISEDSKPFCNWEVKLDEQVISEDKTKAIVVNAKNTADKECQSNISMRAPGFDASPNKEEQEITLQPNGKGAVSWILTPRRTGTYEIAISDFINTKVFGLSVTNTFGLSTFQAKTFSFVGSIFGPMLTIPWWFDRLRSKKQKPEIKQPEV